MRTLNLSDPAVLRESLDVSASAGSGKTYTLTVLVTAGLGKGDLRPFEVLATTFSEAAAADLRERLLRPLDLLASLDEVAWGMLLPLLAPFQGEAVASLLKGLPLPALLRKSATEVAQAAAHWPGAPWTASAEKARAFWRRTRREAELLQVSTIHSLAMRVLSRGAGAGDTILDVAHPALLRLLRQTVREGLSLPEGHPDRVPAKLLLAWAERSWEDLSRGYDQHLDAQGHLDREDPGRHRAALEAALAQARRALAPFAADPMSACEASSPQRRHFKPSCILGVPGEGADLEAALRWAEAQARSVDPSKGYFTEAFRQAMGTFQPVVNALEAWMRCLLVEALGRFEARKAEHRLATFGDLVRQALASLAHHGLEGAAPRLLLVDEYQDTSRSQDAFLAALGAGRTVRVGDVKQAIYGFRGGDPDILRGHLEQAGDHAFRLPSNFRSTPEVVALANRYVGEVWPLLDAHAGMLDGDQVAVAPSAHPVGLVRAPAPGAGTDLPALADWIYALSRNDGWAQCLPGPERGGRRRRALLLKQRTKLPLLLQRLKAQGIQPYVVAKAGFWDSPGVRLLMAALEAVAHPDRALPCATLLRHVVGLSDAELTALGAREGRPPAFPGLAGLDPALLPEVRREGAQHLLDLRQASTQEVAGRLLKDGAVLQAVQALEVHGVLEPLRARRNLAAFLAMLMELPASPSVAFALLEDERAGVERGDLPATPEGADLIIQTVHGSKGLEYDDVILPLLNGQPRAFRRGELRTRAGTGELLFAWSLGDLRGAGYQELKPIVEARQKRDDLNLLYVALTRARERMALLLQEPKEKKEAAEAKTWAQWGQHLADAHPELEPLTQPPTPEPPTPPAVPRPAPPPPRAALRPEGLEAALHAGVPGDAATRARQEGEAMHAYLRDLLVRWEDPGAFQACLEAPPEVPRAKANALRFLAQFEERGWRPLRRRTELPLAGAAASGAQGRADLVVWDADRIHLLDFKHAEAFGEAELRTYQAQLARYAEVLGARFGLPVEAWLVALRSGSWVRT